VDAQLPGIPKGLDHLGLGGQIFVLAVLDVALVDEGLEVAAVFDAVGRVDVDHLHLPGHAFLGEQAVHHQQTVSGDQTVGPAAVVLVELDGLVKWQRLLEPGLQPVVLVRRIGNAGLACAQALAQRGEDGGRVDALVHVQADGVHIEAGALGLAGPVEIGRRAAFQLGQRGAHGIGVAAGQRVVDQRLEFGAAAVELQRGIEVRVVGPGGFGLAGIVVGRDQADLGVVGAMILVPVGGDFLLALAALGADGFAGLARGQRQAALLRSGLLGGLRHGLRFQRQRPRLKAHDAAH